MTSIRNLRALLCVLACPVLFAACGEGVPTESSIDVSDPGAAVDSRIVGGAAYSGMPAVGVLTYYDSPHCTATLVEPDKILTAAHCLFGVNKTKLRFVTGENAAYPDSSTKIASLHVHPYYSASELDHDIAYAILSNDAPVEPMNILYGMDASWRGEDLFFVGYGVDDGYSQTGAGKKRAVWMSISQVDSTTFRYDDPNKNTCNGDSGGPAFAYLSTGEYVVAGVTSWGDWYCTEFGVDTRVDVYADFLGITPPAPPVEEPPVEEPPVVDPPTNQTDPCSGETYEGRCDTDLVIWCENETVYQSDCASDGKTCGWSDTNNYYGCVEPPDPCNGETYEGRCDGLSVIWCESEEVKSIECRRGCGWDSSGGYYNCN